MGTSAGPISVNLMNSSGSPETPKLVCLFSMRFLQLQGEAWSPGAGEGLEGRGNVGRLDSEQTGPAELGWDGGCRSYPGFSGGSGLSPPLTF